MVPIDDVHSDVFITPWDLWRIKPKEFDSIEIDDVWICNAIFHSECHNHSNGPSPKWMLQYDPGRVVNLKKNQFNSPISKCVNNCECKIHFQYYLTNIFFCPQKIMFSFLSPNAMHQYSIT